MGECEQSQQGVQVILSKIFPSQIFLSLIIPFPNFPTQIIPFQTFYSYLKERSSLTGLLIPQAVQIKLQIWKDSQGGGCGLSGREEDIEEGAMGEGERLGEGKLCHIFHLYCSSYSSRVL